MENLLLIIVLGIGALITSSFLSTENHQEDFGFMKKNMNRDDFFRKIKTNAQRIR